MNLPPDIFTGDHYELYQKNVDKIVEKLKSEEMYEETLQKWRNRFMHRRMPPQEIIHNNDLPSDDGQDVDQN